MVTRHLVVFHGPLTWPDGTLRALNGAIVPHDDPAIAGQEWKLRTVRPDDAREITPHDRPDMDRWYAARGYTRVPFVDPAVAEREAAEAARAVKQTEIDERIAADLRTLDEEAGEDA